MGLTSAARVLAFSAVAIIAASSIASASASPSANAREHLQIMSTKATARELSVIATGAFTAGGYDKPGAKVDTIVLPGGRFTFTHVSKSFTAGFDPSTCLLTETQKGTFTIGGGTGKYAGVHGSGAFVTRITGVTAKNKAGQCTHAQAPRTFQGVTTATGTVSM